VLRIKKPRQFLFLRFIAPDIMAKSAGVSYISRIISFSRFARREINFRVSFPKLIRPNHGRKEKDTQADKGRQKRDQPSSE
jgi:hypothetical protein